MVAQPPLWQPPQSQGGLGQLFKRFFGGDRGRPKSPQSSPRLRGKGFIGIRIDQTRGGGMGVYVTEAIDGHPARKAGIRAGDLIAKVGGKRTRTVDELISVVSAMAPGTKTTVQVLRGGTTKTFKLTIGTRPS